MNLPILPTTVVGSYSMPGWLERLKTEFFARRISKAEREELAALERELAAASGRRLADLIQPPGHHSTTS